MLLELMKLDLDKTLEFLMQIAHEWTIISHSMLAISSVEVKRTMAHRLVNKLTIEFSMDRPED